MSVSSLERGPHLVLWANFVERPVTLSWTPVPRATSYDVTVGTTPGAADVFASSTTGLSMTITFPSPGRFYPQVVARNTWFYSAQVASRAPLFMLSFKDFVEALFLGTGPLAQNPQAGCLAGPGTMSGWPSGASVTVTLASSLAADQRRRAAAAAGQAHQATGGVVEARVRDSTDPRPDPGDGEIVVQQADLSGPFPCSTAAAGCTLPLQFLSPAVLSRVRVWLRNENTAGHEIGHALYAFCHLSTEAGYVSVMGNFDQAGRGLSEADLAATQAVYRAGLRAGATRHDFVSAGLVDP